MLGSVGVAGADVAGLQLLKLLLGAKFVGLLIHGSLGDEPLAEFTGKETVDGGGGYERIGRRRKGVP